MGHRKGRCGGDRLSFFQRKEDEGSAAHGVVPRLQGMVVLRSKRWEGYRLRGGGNRFSTKVYFTAYSVIVRPLLLALRHRQVGVGSG